MQWLYIHFPYLQLDSSLSQQGAEQEQPCVLIHQGQVVQTNAAARQVGIRLGTGLAQAALLCSHVTIADYQVRQEQQLLKQLAHQLYQLSATLYLYPPQGLLFQTQDMRRLYKDAAHYWQSLQQPLQERELHYFYAAAHSPLAAQVLAIAQKNQLCEDVSASERLLDQLPISEAGFSPALTEQLQRLGLRLLGQVQSHSRSLRQWYHLHVFHAGGEYRIQVTQDTWQLPHVRLTSQGSTESCSIVWIEQPRAEDQDSTRIEIDQQAYPSSNHHPALGQQRHLLLLQHPAKKNARKAKRSCHKPLQ